MSASLNVCTVHYYVYVECASAYSTLLPHPRITRGSFTKHTCVQCFNLEIKYRILDLRMEINVQPDPA